MPEALSKMQWHLSIQAECHRREIDEATIKRLFSYVDHLLDQGLPVVLDFVHLARLLGLHKRKLAAMIFRTDRFYKRFQIKKHSGEAREISAPSITLKTCQRWILRNILENVVPHPCVQGFVRKRSILTNAAVHVGAHMVVNVDVKDFFPSIGWDRVFHFFRRLGYSKKSSFYLTRLTTLNGVLPQGAPTSPMISNHIAKHLDARLSGLARSIGYSYSRYADDLTFSGDSKLACVIPLIGKIVKEEGFVLNDAKTKIMRRHQRQEVTGLVVNHRVAVSRSHRRWLRQQIYYVGRFGPDSHSGRLPEPRKNTREFLYGHALFVGMTDPAMGKVLLEELGAVSW
jgi:RNA-directed DNA polymerase